MIGEQKISRLWQVLISWLTGGIIYFYMEILFRGFSHYTMLICGGVCFVLVGTFGRHLLEKRKLDIWIVLGIMIIGSLIITTTEYFTGILVNIRWNMDVWSYEELPFNYKGQICLLFSMIWSLLSLVCVFLESTLQKHIYQ